MKTVLTGILLVTLSACCNAQEAKDSLFIVTYTTGPLWDTSKNPGEQMHFKEHSSRLGQLRKDGVIKFGARYADKGIVVIAAPTTAAAREIVFVDQAVANKLFVADIQKLSIFYDGCLERIR